MNRILILPWVAGMLVILSSCTMVNTQVYDGPSNTDYVYTVSYYPNGIPWRYNYNRYIYNRASYWDNSSYYNGYGVQPNAYWGTYEYYTSY